MTCSPVASAAIAVVVFVAPIFAAPLLVETPVPTPPPSAWTAEHKLFVQDAAWSPDGKRIAFSRYDASGPYAAKNWTIWIAGRDGSNPRAVLRGAVSCVFSPDGNRLAAGMLFDGDWEVVTVRADGTDLKRITNRKGSDYLPAWSPDGSFLVYCADVEGSHDLYRVGVDGTGLKRLTHGSGKAFNPAFSPDGKRIVFYLETGDRHDQIWTLDLATGREERVTDGTGHNFFPSFLPDGRIAFSGQPDGGERRLMVVSKDGARFDPLGPAGINVARWSPDGKEILFLGGPDKGEIRRMAADGTGAAVLLATASLADSPPPPR
jgi:dipeptidyl aminopeptidase/acylaminoacyl peptidase